MQHIYNNDSFGENWFSYPNLYSYVVNKFPSGSHFVEVGSWKGKSSAYMAVEIANSNKNIKFDCVDTWRGSIEHENIDIEQLYNTFLSNMKPVADYYSHHRMTSVEASKLYENNSLDFVFIDACHEYECVKEDIISWLPKIKNGGVIAGHDYIPEFFGVVMAVDEILVGKQLKFQERCWIYQL
jgi:hypothetical protein